MTNRVYKILKYIHKHPKISRKNLVGKFPDFVSYSLAPYITIDNQIEIEKSREETELMSETVSLTMAEMADYIKAHKSVIKEDDSRIFYSTNHKFQEYYEARKRKTRSVWVSFFVTTFIAIASLVVQFIKN